MSKLTRNDIFRSMMVRFRPEQGTDERPERMAQEAQNIIDRNIRKVLERGWWFNTEVVRGLRAQPNGFLDITELPEGLLMAYGADDKPVTIKVERNGTAAPPTVPPEDIITPYQVVCSDLVSDLVPTINAGYITIVTEYELQEINMTLLTASTGGPVSVRIRLRDGTILVNEITLASGTLSINVPVIPDTIAPFSDVIVDITSAGVGAKGLIVTLIGTQFAED